MVKRVIIGRSGEERLVDLIQAIERKATAGDTRPTGVKVMDDDENFYWARPDGTEHSVREVDEGLTLAEGRIADAETSLGQTQTRLDDAEQAVTVVQGDLNTLETETLPNAVAALEQADAAAAQELTTLDGKLVTAQGELETAKGNITQLGTDLAAESDARQQLASDTQTTFTELDTRLDTFGDDPSLATLRNSLTAAQDAATAAQATADDAVQAASAANQAALTAAGIADSKGKVIYSESEPAAEDQSTSNLWIKPSTEETRVWDETSGSWELITSDLLDQAAQNALDAKQAASAAQSTADSAKADAATAQAAAVAAQQTADQATLDAADAHNAAVAAADRLDAVRADMAQGPSLWEDPSFERGPGGVPALFPGSIDRSQEWASTPGGWSVKYTASGNGGNNYGVYGYLDLTPGRWYAVSVTVHAGDAPQQWRTVWDGRTAANELDAWLILPGTVDVPAGQTVKETWFFQVPETSAQVRYWAGQSAAFNQPEHTGQTVFIDDFRIADVTESYPQYLAAQQAADDAQARADEAYAEAASKLDEAEIDAKITASANGKNSITRSLSAPSGDGVVHGDQWYQVDGNGDAFASWYWGASGWTPSLIKNEMMESLDVHKLQVTGEATMDSAVIDKLWVDGLVAKSAIFNQISVASGNILIDPQGLNPELRDIVGGAGWSWDDTGKYWKRAAVQGGTTQYEAYSRAGSVYDSNLMDPDAMYVISFEVWVDTVGPDTAARSAIYFKRTDGTTSYVGDATEEGGDTDHWDQPILAGQWNKVTRHWRAPSDVSSGGFNFQLMWGGADSTEVRIRKPFVGKQAATVMIEDGAVNAQKVNAESVGATVGEFVHAEVGNLVATNGIKTPEAVIDKVWADGIAAKSVTTSSLTVARGNILPNGQGELGDNTYWPNFTYVPDAPAETGAVGGFRSSAAVFCEVLGEAPVPIEAGQEYLGDVWIHRASVGGDTAIAFDYLDASGTYIARDYAIWPKGMPAGLSHHEGSFTPPAGATHLRLNIVPSHSNGTSSAATFYGLRVRPKVGAVLIEDGAITAPKITITGDPNNPDEAGLIANLVDAMGVETKKLVVTESAVLRHSTLIGKTVVDDINVQGKLIGTDGVFTGTVDFANINVTGEVLADKISGTQLSGNTIEGGQISTTTASFAYASLSSGEFTYYGPGGPTPAAGLSFRGSPSGPTWGYVYAKPSNAPGSNPGIYEIQMALGNISGETHGGAVNVYRNTADTGGGVNVISKKGDGSWGPNLRVSDRGVEVAGIPTTSASANVNLPYSAGGDFRLSTSSRRYKRNIADWSPNADAVLALQPRQWQHDDPNSPIDERWHVGFIAEEVDDLGLRGLVRYSGDGAGGWLPEGLNYDRFAAAQQVVLQKHEAEIKALEARIALLESK